MKTFKELLKTETYWITKIQNDLFNAVEDYLEANKMTRTQFARQLGVSKGYVSQVLNGEFNHRLSKLIELALAIGKAPMLEFEDLEEVVEKESRGMVRRKAGYVPRAPFSMRVQHGEMGVEQLSRPSKKKRLPNATMKAGEGRWKLKAAITYSTPAACEKKD